MYAIVVLIIIQTAILTVFVVQSIRQRKYGQNIVQEEYKPLGGDIDVIIASRESFEMTCGCLDSVLSSGMNNIILCMDGGDKSVTQRIIVKYPTVHVLYNEKPLGKIKSQIKCLKTSKSQDVLVLDADIRLIPKQIPDFIACFSSGKADFLCPYSLGNYQNNISFLSRIEETDRYMRQRIVRAGRDAYGVSNLSGYCMLANRKKYIEIVDSEATQDDVIATMNLLQKGYVVRTYHHVVCSEIERNTFVSYLLQKTRWTAGNIKLIASYPKLFRVTDKRKALAFSSSFLLWYWALWIDCIAMALCPFFRVIAVLLAIEFTIKYTGLVAASRPNSRLGYNLAYLFVWPVFSMICLMLTPYYLTGKINEQKTRR